MHIPLRELVLQSWRVTYTDLSGRHIQHDAESEEFARTAAAGASRHYGCATVTDADGLVATYVDGELAGGAA